ncbi:lipopolysaccharide biosynthesis protein [Vibrio vulnificus]|uniref:lipopolysaccharide biosynthesis protein n=1 Tax=Vibrio vulnificus TaxID=672 RepID=UPI001CDB6F57|nr:oligosaccharide flippase family protein [Vibrio vulnificus]MCA3894942.1 oligosaccharide flippase family protein [Vibrio vulnificus]
MNIKTIILFSVGPVGSAILGLISVPIAAWYFSSESIGKASLIQVLLSFFLMVISLGLDQAYIREYHARENKVQLFKECFSVSFIISLIVVILVYLFYSQPINNYFDNPFIGFLESIIIIFEIALICKFFLLILRMEEKGFEYSFNQLIVKLSYVSILSLIVVLGVDRGFTELYFAQFFGYVLSLILIILLVKDSVNGYFYNSISINNIKRYMRFGFPLIFSGAAFWGLTTIDRFFISNMSSMSELGIYSVAISFATVASILQSVFTTVWSPIVYKSIESDDATLDLTKISRYMQFIVMLVFSVSGLMSWMLNFLLPSEYESLEWIIIPCLGYPLLFTLSEVTAIGIGITKKTSLTFYATLIAFSFNCIGNYFFVPLLGAGGAALSTLISFCLFLIIRTELSKAAWKSITNRTLYLEVLSVAVLSIFGVLVGSSHGNSIRVLWFVFMLFTIYRYQTEIRDLYTTIKCELKKG